MLRLLIFLVSLGAYAIRALFLSQADLLTENLALRQQVANSVEKGSTSEALENLVRK
jgi:hypothetical protein